jgi:putative oxidoreductase
LVGNKDKPLARGWAVVKERFSQAVWAPRALAALPIVAGYLFVQHGTAKLFGVPHVAMFDHLNLLSLLGLAGVLELLGGALIMFGLFTRPAAFILSGQMAVAYFITHAPRGNLLLPTLNKGEAAVLYCFVFLLLSVVGPGAWSIDSMRKSEPTARRPTPA